MAKIITCSTAGYMPNRLPGTVRYIVIVACIQLLIQIMRKRNEVLSNVGQGSSAGAGVVMSLEEEKRGRGHRNRLFTFFVFLTLASVLVYILLFAEYAWVFRRCFLSTFWNWSIRAQMECSEAYNHRLAMLEPRLWAPPKFVPQQKQALQHIHFTLTGALSLQPWKLALCSIQIASKNLCVDIATGNSRCTVNIWMVDTSTNANKMNQKLRRKGRPVIPHYNSTDTITEELIQLLGNQNGSLWCIRKVLASTIHPKGPNCVPLNNRARDLRRWLTVGAKNQLPEHRKCSS